MNARTLLYRALFAARHPDAVGLWRRGVDYDQYRRLRKGWLDRLGIRSVLDVGANVGQFARLAHAVLPAANIYSFEPLPECFERLSRTLPGFAGFRAFKCAIGEASSESEFFRSSHSPSSSFLKMTALHETAFPDSRGIEPVRVRMRTLDEVVAEINPHEPIMVKIDVQGYEDRVIKGAETTLGRTAMALIETSYFPLYVGQPLFADLLGQMGRLGFVFQGNFAEYEDPSDGRPLFADSLFVSRSVANGVTRTSA